MNLTSSAKYAVPLTLPVRLLVEVVVVTPVRWTAVVAAVSSAPAASGLVTAPAAGIVFSAPQ